MPTTEFDPFKESARQRAVSKLELYSRGEYTTLISEYTKDLELSNVPVAAQIRALDIRAATWEKIGGVANLELALQDARMMIQLSKAHTAGYLRAGDIFELLNQDNSALDIYADGMRQLKPDSLDFEVSAHYYK